MSIDDYLFFNDPADMGNDDPFDIDPNDIVLAHQRNGSNAR